MTGYDGGQYRTGEIVLLPFPFTGAPAVRRRPALVLLDTGDADVVLARITSRPPRTPFDVQIVEWRRAGLLIPSVVRLDKVATLEKRNIEQRLGMLTVNDLVQVRVTVQRLWASI
jgi:mRNA interferase MazF